MDTLSQMGIWNRALGFLGTRSVASERENTPEAIQCRLYWDNARRQVLRDFPWPFAQRRGWLARLPLPDGYELEYRYAYALPENCLKAHEVRHEGRHKRPFALARHAESERTMLLTDAARALLLYTEDVSNCQLFDDLFASDGEDDTNGSAGYVHNTRDTSELDEAENEYNDLLVDYEELFDFDE